MTEHSRAIEILITDLDNTLYDWEAFFIPSFVAMLGVVERISGVPRELLEESFRRVYQRHRTTEYAFVLQEADALREVDGDLTAAQVFEKYDEAIHAFRSTRRRTLRLYPGVKSTLVRLRDAGVVLVAHSDSPMEYVSRRLRQLDIDTLFAAVSAPRDHGIPEAILGAPIRQAPDADVGARTLRIEFDASLRKPDPAALEPLLAAFPSAPERTLYVGDNLSRDILLARRVGIKSAWARYGTTHDNSLRSQLYRITYWTDADVENETQLRQEVAGHEPTYVLDTFADLEGVADLTT